MEINDLIKEFSETRPNSEYIVGYGSGVMRGEKNSQIDLIFGVNDSSKWHEENHEMNPSDYKSNLGYNLLPLYGNLGTRVNYLSHLPFEGHMFKIGVVNKSDLISDLLHWDNFFLAGRFQKPVDVIKSDDELDIAIRLNRMQALKTALLSSGKRNISGFELYELICSLSYIGDWRCIVPVENKDKIRNIVEGSFNEFHEIYSSVNHGYYEESGQGEFVINYDNLFTKLETLPEPLRNKILSLPLDKDMSAKDLEILRKAVLNYFVGINIRTSAFQPLKGLSLNGFCKTLTYLEQKLEKR